ncbi:substrate-binding domain-containing protein [Clostridioides sp. GD02404]|uniref:sugar ABC transporter substrate-binding protein n=1 Tax=Clostridioides sp. GD02404 TaxID=3054354 RepID=UPI0038AAACBB
MKRIISLICIAVLFLVSLSGCESAKQNVKIGVSFGVGSATRWQHEKEYMEQQAKKLGADIEVRLNQTDKPKTQKQDCFEMIDNGIDVLIITPRDVNKVQEILDYAKEKNVPVINYARVVLGEKVDLFVGYDSSRIGQRLGQYLSEIVYDGDYIILQGDTGDNNAKLLYQGAMRYISPIKDNINILLDAPVKGWSPDEAKKMVIEAVSSNNNNIDAILAPNDKIAGACVDALKELGISKHVVITGMDAEIDAAKRIVEGTQDVTIYMDLNELACTAVNEAVHMVKNETINVNSEFDNQSGSTIKANLITGQLVTKENLDKILIDNGYFTKEQVYGKN